MQKRKNGQKEQETNLILDYWFKYCNSTDSMPSIDDFAINFLKIPKSKILKIRKGEKIEDNLEITGSQTIHPITFKELFKENIDKWLNNQQKQILKTFKDHENIVVEVFHCILPQTLSYNGFYSLKGYKYPAFSVVIKAGIFYPNTTASFGITTECINRMQ